MRLSTFSAANPHPKTKEEKRTEAFKFSAPYLPVSVEFDNEDELISIVTSKCWSPFVFSGSRHADNFVSCDLLVYDIDSGMTIDEAKEKIEKLKLACLVLPTTSHSESAHRFRAILPLAKTITNPTTYEATWNAGAIIFGTADQQTKDLARAYFGCTQEDGFWNEGTMFEPQAPEIKMEQAVQKHSERMLPVSGDINETVEAIYGEKRSFVPEAVDFFIRNAHTGLEGQWTNSLNRFCFSLALSEVPDCAILALCEQLAPQSLDSKDLYQIKRAINDAKKV